MFKFDLTMVIAAVVTFFVACVISFGATPVVKKIAQSVGAMDIPKDDRRMHKKPIPRLGGLAIFFGFMFAILLFANITMQIKGILLGSVIIVALGILDDVMPLNAAFKFVVQIMAALVVVFHGTVIQTISNPNVFSQMPYLDLRFLAIPVTVIWIVGITNSVNLIDGLDGLAVGISSISAVSMLIIAIMVSEGNIAIIMAALAGACIGFLPYNINPAKIFMGDTGSTFLGFILASISISGMFKFYAVVSFAVPFLVLALPLFDTLFAITRRLLKGKSPMSADRGHVHHRLIDMGFSQKQTVTILYVLSGILGLSAVVLTSNGEIRSLLLIITIVISALIGWRIFSEYSKNSNSSQDSQD